MLTSRLTTLGGFAFKVKGVPAPGLATRKARALMTFLIMNRGANVARERLLETFWPDVDPDHARASLSTALSMIRAGLRTIGTEAEGFILTTKSVVQWNADARVDAEQFAELAGRDDASASRAAVRLYRGDFLEGDYDDWTVAQRERLTTLYETVLTRAVKMSRDPEAARLLIARNPFAEDAYATLIETELEAGRRAAAAALGERCRKALCEVGEKPSEAFEERFGHVKVRTLDVPPSNLPRQTTTFVGREAELAEVEALLAKSQLVTIVGSGGVGKTRAAVRAAADVLRTYDDGVWFADLATVSGEDAVIPEIASAFGVKSTGFRTLFDHVLAHLKHKRLLLVLDNCDHVVAEAARVVDAIVAVSPGVTVLATSRERLGAYGEHVYRLPSLGVPPLGKEMGAEEALKFGAVALFLARASANDTSFAFADDKVNAVIEICRHLDGIALAIELAAARVTTLHVHELLDRLRKEFRFLKGDDRTVHPRYKTMRATLDWSYEWLSEEEKAMFRRLGIFRGGWTIETIYAVGVDESLDEFAVLDHLWPLVNKSLVAVEFGAESQRYRLTEPLRQYALELLKEQGEVDATASHHARYFTEFARQASANWTQVPDVTFVANFETEIDNIRAALEWSLSQRKDPVLGAELAAYLGPFWFTQRYHEGLRWLGVAQAAITYDEHPGLSVAIANHRLRAYLQAPELDEALRVGEGALGPARQLGDEWLLTRLLMFYGAALLGANRVDEAEDALKESLEVTQRVGDHYRSSWNLWSLAKLYRKRGKFDVARDFAVRMAAAFDQLQRPLDRNRWVALTGLARTEELDGRLSRAIELCREAHSVTQVTKDVLGSVHVQHYLGALLLLSGAVTEARTNGRSLVKLSTDELFPHGIPPALQILAGVASQTARHELAARLLGFAEAGFQRRGLARDFWVEVEPEWFIRPLRDHFGETKLAELMAEGASWSEDRAIEEALEI